MWSCESGVCMFQVVRTTHTMLETYSGLSVAEFADVLHLRLFAQSLKVAQYLAQTHDASSKKQTCANFFRILAKLDR